MTIPITPLARRPDVGRAIATIEQSRQTHVDWCRWLEAHPEEIDRVAGTVHPPREQREIIAEYDNVLNCLRELRETAAEIGAPDTIPNFTEMDFAP